MNVMYLDRLNPPREEEKKEEGRMFYVSVGMKQRVHSFLCPTCTYVTNNKREKDENRQREIVFSIAGLCWVFVVAVANMVQVLVSCIKACE